MEKIEKIFNKKNIKFVLLDMDGTLVDTSTYFDEEMTNAIINIVSKIYPDLPLSKQIKITKEILKLANETYIRDRTPSLVDIRTLNAIEKYFKKKNIKIKKSEISKSLKSLYKEFYITSPLTFPYTIQTLHRINRLGIKMGVYSHAQKGWTKVKVATIKKEYLERYHINLKLPFFTTKITDSKDKLGWVNAGKYFELDLKKTLVIGDSITSDIYPALQAGYGYAIYLRHNNRREHLPTDETSRIFQTKNLGNIFS
jgi:FMN phosphatase YigB (HAD superfamily)